MTDKDRYELKIAGLLHDCGKITTPVHVVDKATKLQTIFDRIDLIDTRFEVLKRDAEIELCRAQLAALQAATRRRWPKPSASRHARLAAHRRGPRVPAPLQHRRRVHAARGPGARAADRARYRWRDPDGAMVPFLTDDEIENLTIPAGTLTRGRAARSSTTTSTSRSRCSRRCPGRGT